MLPQLCSHITRLTTGRQDVTLATALAVLGRPRSRHPERRAEMQLQRLSVNVPSSPGPGKVPGLRDDFASSYTRSESLDCPITYQVFVGRPVRQHPNHEPARLGVSYASATLHPSSNLLLFLLQPLNIPFSLDDSESFIGPHHIKTVALSRCVNT